jgi:hypothetical protein
MWDLWWTKWHWDRFFSEFLDFPLSVHNSTVALQTDIIWGMRNLLMSVGIHAWALDPPHLQETKELRLFLLFECEANRLFTVSVLPILLFWSKCSVEHSCLVCEVFWTHTALHTDTAYLLDVMRNTLIKLVAYRLGFSLFYEHNSTVEVQILGTQFRLASNE